MKRNPIHRIFIVAAIAAVLPACGLFHKKADYYSQAAEARPLEVPPDLDTPPTANELAVPQAGSAAPGGAVSTAPTGSPVESLGATELRVAEDVAGTWRKVGVALDRAKVGTVSARDENAHSYTVDFTGSVSTRPQSERHWYTPVLEHLGFGEDENKEVTRHVTVVVAADAGGSRVSVTSDGADRLGADSTRRVADVLRQNLAISAAPVAAAPAPVAPAPVAAAPAAAAPAAPPAAVGVSVAGSELVVSDSVQNAYARVGLALERAQIGTLSGRDEAAHTYTLDFNSTVETQPAPTEHHWYTRILHPFGGGKGKTETVRRSLVVRVAEDGAGARISIEGDTTDKSTADAAKRVIEVLRDRLS